MKRPFALCLMAALSACLATPALAAESPRLTPHKGDRIILIGNTLLIAASST